MYKQLLLSSVCHTALPVKKTRAVMLPRSVIGLIHLLITTAGTAILVLHLFGINK